MKQVDYSEYYGGDVECPFCGRNIELGVRETRHVTGEEVTCRHCHMVFELGGSK